MEKEAKGLLSSMEAHASPMSLVPEDYAADMVDNAKDMLTIRLEQQREDRANLDDRQRKEREALKARYERAKRDLERAQLEARLDMEEKHKRDMLASTRDEAVRILRNANKLAKVQSDEVSKNVAGWRDGVMAILEHCTSPRYLLPSIGVLVS